MYVHTVGHTGNEDSSLCVRVEGSAEGSHSSNVPGDPPKASFSTHPIYLAFICMYVCMYYGSINVASDTVHTPVGQKRNIPGFLR